MTRLTAERARELLSYEPSTGRMFWRQTLSNRALAGSEAGSRATRGNGQIKVEGRVYKFHHIVWLMACGEWPEMEIDHIDGDPLNNRIANLRLATSAQNSWNTRKHADNKAGFKGVSPEGRRFVAAIMVKGVKHRLGSFDTADAAHRAYCAAAERLHGEFARVA